MSVAQYLFRTSLKIFMENRIMTLVAIGTTALALLVVGGMFLLQQNVSSLVEKIRSQASVIVYLEDDVSEQDRQELESRLLSDERVRHLEFKSREQALAEFRDRLGSNVDLLEGLKSNPLPASLHLSLNPKAVDTMDAFAADLQQWEGVETVDYGQEFLRRIQVLSQTVQVSLGLIGGIICLIAVFIIFNTAQLAVIAHRSEIEILKLVGATRSFIGLPFVTTGMFQGIIGSLLGCGLLWLFFLFVKFRLSALPFLPANVLFLDWIQLTVMVSMGLGLGVFGSATAVYRDVRTM